MSFYMLSKFYASNIQKTLSDLWNICAWPNFLKISLLSIFLFTNIAEAQNSVIRNEDGTTLYGSELQSGDAAAVDAAGRYLVSSTSPTGLTESQIPVSRATELNGPPVAMVGFSRVTSGTVTSGSTTTVINITGIQAAGATVGDVLFLTTPAATGNTGAWSYITAVATNAVTVGTPFRSAPANSDGYVLKRPNIIDASSSISQTGTSLMVGIDANYQNSTSSGILKATDAAWGGAGDAGVMAMAVMNTDESSLVPTEGDYMPFAVAGNGVVKVSVTNGGQKDGASGLIKNEDTVASSGDAGVMKLGVSNEAGNTLAADGDYTPFAVTTKGVGLINIDNAFQRSQGAGILKLEDGSASSGDAGVMLLAERQDQLITGKVGGNNRYAANLVDTLSRLYVNPWGAAVTEFIQGCNSAVTTATTGAMLAAEASQRFYVSSWSCTNTGGAASRVILEDGAGTDFANVMLPATTGFASVQFPTPVRASAANSAIQINVITTGTSTICCFNGFKSAY